MKAYDIEIPEEAIEACRLRMRQGRFTTSEIEAILISKGVPRQSGNYWIFPANRAADRIVQKARKMRLVRIVARCNQKAIFELKAL